MREEIPMGLATVFVLAVTMACKGHKPAPSTSSSSSSAPVVTSATVAKSTPADFSKLDMNSILASVQAAGYPKAKLQAPAGGTAIGLVLRDIFLGNPKQGVVGLATFSSSKSYAYRIGASRYLTVHLEDGADTFVDGLLKGRTVDTITRKQIGAYLRAQGWGDIENLDDDLDTIFAEKDGTTVDIDLRDESGHAVATDASHFLFVATGEGRSADDKLLRAIVGP